MSNPSSVDGLPAVIVTGTGEVTVSLNQDREYTIAHRGQDASGGADTATIYLAVDAATDADASEGANKAILKSGEALSLCGGVNVLRLKTASGAPTVNIIPGPRLMGAW